MHREKKDEEAGVASYKAVVAGVKEEMAQPRIAKSARANADEQSKKSHGKPTSPHAGRIAKPHIEQYGTGTPSIEK
jgi:Cu/Zn superoxide dismutase